MKYRVSFLEFADRDIDVIEAYLSQFYESTVQNFFTELKKKVLMLEGMPYMYPAYERDPFFRQIVLSGYLLFYSVNEEQKLVDIHHIFHHSRDIDRLIAEYRERE
jgi:plasmid stabilization system protein ParE